MNRTRAYSTGLLVFLLSVAALLLWVLHDPERYGFIALGTTVGWSFYYFVRRYRVFSPKTLTATLTAILGGEALAWANHFRGGAIDVEARYFAGLGIGFFSYGLYAGFCSWLYATGVLKNAAEFEMAVGCRVLGGHDYAEDQAIKHFEQAAMKWSLGKLSDDAFTAVLDRLSVTRSRLAELVETTEIKLPSEVVGKLRAARILR